MKVLCRLLGHDWVYYRLTFKWVKICLRCDHKEDVMGKTMLDAWYMD